MISYQLLISGKVQGVFYRVSTRDKARELGIVGFVRNEKDGSVYAEIEGEEDAVQKLIDWCKIGSPGANVTKVSVVEQKLRGFTGFEIRRN